MVGFEKSCIMKNGFCQKREKDDIEYQFRETPRDQLKTPRACPIKLFTTVIDFE